VPPELFNSDQVQFLVIDDASNDRGVQVAKQWANERDIRNLGRQPLALSAECLDLAWTGYFGDAGASSIPGI
jgi:hypothetical protein